MTAAVIAKATTAPRRSGVGHWLRSFWVMFLWNVVRLRLAVVVVAMVQAFTGAGLVVGFSLFFRDIAPDQVLFLGSGAVVITMVTIGLVMGPQMIGEQRLSGSFDWYASLPTPRSAAAAAWTFFNILVALPGVVAAIVAVRLRFDVALEISLLVVPAITLVLLAGTLVGYAYAHALPNPRTISLASQLMIFIVFGFSPIAFPARNMPDWLSSLHEYLPFVHMGNVVRAGLTTGLVENVTRSFVVLAIWTVAAAMVSTWAIGRRA